MKSSKYLSRIFDLSCKTAKKGWEAAAWSSEDSQQFLFELCIGVTGRDGTILDVGCGHADLYEYLEKSKNYTGIDISKRMIEAARKKYPRAKVENADLSDFQEQHDWVVGVGPFNLDISVEAFDLSNDKIQMDYLEESLFHMYRLAKKGLVLTLLSNSLVQKKEQVQGLYYYETAAVVYLCEKFSNKIMVDQVSSPNQFMLMIPKV